MSGTVAVAGRLYESTQERIKEYILSHRLRAGDALPAEGSLARELGISRTSVREAVKALESVGILETRPGVGLFVRPFSFDPIVANLGYSLLFDHHTLAELLAVRTQLEAGFIETAAAEVTPDQLRVLRSLVDRMGERAALRDGPGDFKEEDRAFHRTLYIGLGNQLLLKMLDVFWTVYRRLRDQAHVEAIDNVRTWENHRRIVEALERRDGPGARRAMLEHFGGIRARIHSALDDVVQQRPGRAGGGGGRGAAGGGESGGARA